MGIHSLSVFISLLATIISDVLYRQNDEPLELDLTQQSQQTQFAGGPEYTVQSSYDLISAVQRQSAFYYNVSLPHYKDNNFLMNAIQRYKVRKLRPRPYKEKTHES